MLKIFSEKGCKKVVDRFLNSSNLNRWGRQHLKFRYIYFLHFQLLALGLDIIRFMRSSEALASRQE